MKTTVVACRNGYYYCDGVALVAAFYRWNYYRFHSGHLRHLPSSPAAGATLAMKTTVDVHRRENGNCRKMKEFCGWKMMIVMLSAMGHRLKSSA